MSLQQIYSLKAWIIWAIISLSKLTGRGSSPFSLRFMFTVPANAFANLPSFSVPWNLPNTWINRSITTLFILAETSTRYSNYHSKLAIGENNSNPLLCIISCPSIPISSWYHILSIQNQNSLSVAKPWVHLLIEIELLTEQVDDSWKETRLESHMQEESFAVIKCQWSWIYILYNA